MTTMQIKGHMLLKGYGTVEELADRIGERRDAVSQVINYLRANERIRKKIERRLGVRFNRRAPLRGVEQERQQRAA